MFNRTPPQLIRKASSHAAVNAGRLLVHKYPSLYIARYIQLSELEVRKEKHYPRFYTTVEDSNPGSLSPESDGRATTNNTHTHTHARTHARTHTHTHARTHAHTYTHNHPTHTYHTPLTPHTHTTHYTHYTHHYIYRLSHNHTLIRTPQTTHAYPPPRYACTRPAKRGQRTLYANTVAYTCRDYQRT